MVIEIGSVEDEVLPSTPSRPLTADLTERANPQLVTPQSPTTPRIRNSMAPSLAPASPSRPHGMPQIQEDSGHDDSTGVASAESIFVEETVYDGSSSNFHLSPRSLYEEEMVEDNNASYAEEEVVENDGLLVEIIDDESSGNVFQDESSQESFQNHQSPGLLDETALADRSIPTEISYDDSQPDDDDRSKTDRMTVIEEADSADETSKKRDHDVVDANASNMPTRSEVFSSANRRVSDEQASSPDSFGTPEQGNAPVLTSLDPIIIELSETEPRSEPICSMEQHYEPKNSTRQAPGIVDITGPIENASSAVSGSESPFIIQDSKFMQFPEHSLPNHNNSESDSSWPHTSCASRAVDPPAVTSYRTIPKNTYRNSYFDQVKEIPGDAVSDRDYYFCQVEEVPANRFAGVTAATALGATRRANSDEDMESKPLYFQDAPEVEDEIMYDELNSYNFMFEEQHPASGDEEEVILEEMVSDGDPEAPFMEAFSNEDYEDDNEKEMFIDEDTPNSTERNYPSFWILLLVLLLIVAVGLTLWILFVDNESHEPEGPLKYEVLSGPFTGDPSTGFGSSISLDGDVLVVGLPATASGEIQSFMVENKRSASIPSTIIGEESGSGFGWSVDVAGTVAIVGAPFLLIEDTPTPGGGVSVYSYSDSGWVQVGATIRGDEDIYAANEAFGWSVSVAVTETVYRVVIGAPLSNLNDFEIGRVYTFENSLTGMSKWIRTEIDPLIGERAGDRFGSSVAISKDGTTFIAGSPGGDLHDYPGKAFVYKYSGFDWNLAFAIGGYEDNESLGASVAILSNDGDMFAIGAPNFREGSGRIAVFRKSLHGLYAQIGSDIVGEIGDKIGERNLMDGSVRSTGIQVVVATAHGKIRRYDYVATSGNWTTVFEELASGNVTSLSVSDSGASSIAVGTSDGEVTVYGPTFEFEGQLPPLNPTQPLSGRYRSV